MKLSRFPTHSLRSLAARLQGLDVALGDNRIVMRAAIDLCFAEIDRRLSGGDFPEVGDGEARSIDALINDTEPAEFARAIFELEG